MAGFPKGDKKLGDKAKRPMPGIPLDKNVIIKLIRESRGNLSRVADALGTTRTGIRNRVKADQEIADALEEARERRLDNLEECVWSRAEESQDTALQIFMLKTQGRSRGYDQDLSNSSQDIARAAFEFVLNKSKNPAE